MPTLHESTLDALTQAALARPAQDIVLVRVNGGTVIATPAKPAMSPCSAVLPDPVITIDTLSAGPFGNTIPTQVTTLPRRNIYDLTFADLAHSRRSSEGVYIFVGPTSCLTLPAAVAAYTCPNPRLHTAQAALMLHHPDPKTPAPNGMSTTLFPNFRRLAAPANATIH